MLITRSDVAHFFGLVGIVYLLVFIIVALVVVKKISQRLKTKPGRFFAGVGSFLLVFALFYGWLIPDIIAKYQRKMRYQTAKALFDEKCKTAGEKIYRTVDNVEGITLLRVPKPYRNAYAYDPMWEEAALFERGGGGHLFLSWGYIRKL